MGGSKYDCTLTVSFGNTLIVEKETACVCVCAAAVAAVAMLFLRRRQPIKASKSTLLSRHTHSDLMQHADGFIYKRD